jgi:hypothetical protein
LYDLRDVVVILDISRPGSRVEQVIASHAQLEDLEDKMVNNRSIDGDVGMELTMHATILYICTHFLVSNLVSLPDISTVASGYLP